MPWTKPPAAPVASLALFADVTAIKIAPVQITIARCLTGTD
jgi:hypothetical protein